MQDSKATLLVVEDDVDVADMLLAYFRVQGYDVINAYAGEEALQKVQSRLPDLVILDIRLPDFDGYEVARLLRSNRRTRELPILFLTDKRHRNDRLHGLELGADDYITKPFDIQELRLRVRNALRRASEGSLTNPITGLPEGALVEERLRDCLVNQDWAIMLVCIENLDAFREEYGFVASDDVLRAVSLMIRNILREVSNVTDMVGQWGPHEFIVFTTLNKQPALSDQIRQRLEQSLEYFYPVKDRGVNDQLSTHLKIDLHTYNQNDGPVTSLKELKTRL